MFSPSFVDVCRFFYDIINVRRIYKKKQTYNVKTMDSYVFYRACVLRWKIQWNSSSKVVVYQSTECASKPSISDFDIDKIELFYTQFLSTIVVIVATVIHHLTSDDKTR